ncbi:DUF465 domain-containing protein [Altererythrobacter aurantiacus]|uniref:DUF465 domain-containing protein n=1 Tax=Parapontixanthobacter aurantiacus TaxID=1463599 RepID=A0A844ZAE8_9SPHN|nr:YdcH family protein [Parapontixanthobacter aurantiacus]MXO84494.1 DUF465 domain-containing protein [Parapontixanthobacter aurantiacus]
MRTKPSDGAVSQPYLRKLIREHRLLDRRIDTTKAIGSAEKLKDLKRLRLRLKDRIAALLGNTPGRSVPL